MNKTKNMKYISYLILIILLNFCIVNVNAENVGCTYDMSSGCYEDYKYIQKDGKFTAIIDIDKKGDQNLTIDSTSVIIYNNNEATKGWIVEEDTSMSAVKYYKKYESCPPFFAIVPEPDLSYIGYFVNNKNNSSTKYAACVFELEEIEYSENLDREEEIFVCSLRSSNVNFMDNVVNVSINYTNKTISFDSETTVTENDKKALEKFKKNFDYTKKNKCPTDQLKICTNQNLKWIYPKDYDKTPTKNCAILDITEELISGETYCGAFKNYKEGINNYNKDSLKEFCNTTIAYNDYDSNEYSCMNMCLNIEKYISLNNKTVDTKCGFSERLLNFFVNILKWVKYILPAIVIVLGILDFIKAMGSEKEDEMKKAQGKFIKRLIAAALVFIAPLVLEFVLEKMGFSYDSCGLF